MSGCLSGCLSTILVLVCVFCGFQCCSVFFGFIRRSVIFYTIVFITVSAFIPTVIAGFCFAFTFFVCFILVSFDCLTRVLLWRLVFVVLFSCCCVGVPCSRVREGSAASPPSPNVLEIKTNSIHTNWRLRRHAYTYT